MSIFDKNSPEYQRFRTNMKTSWIYRSLAWVTPRQAGWVFFGSALVTIILFFFAINENITQHTYSDLFVVMALLTFIIGLFAIISWFDDRYIKDEDARIGARYGLHGGVFLFLLVMSLKILGIIH